MVAESTKAKPALKKGALVRTRRALRSVLNNFASFTPYSASKSGRRQNSRVNQYPSHIYENQPFAVAYGVAT